LSLSDKYAIIPPTKAAAGVKPTQDNYSGKAFYDKRSIDYSVSQAKGGLNMINEKFVAILRNKKDQIIKLWLDDFRKTRTLRIIEGIDEDKWSRIMGEVMDGFDEVLTKDISKYRICLDFTQFGREVFKDNYATHDIINALSLLKKVIIEVVTTEGFFGTAFQLFQLQELNNKAILYFDRATYYAVLGYEESIKGEMEDRGILGRLKKFFGSSDERKEHMDTCAVELPDEKA
jgi:hypothetical protein